MMLERKLFPTISASVHSLRWQSKIRQRIAQHDQTPPIEWHLSLDNAIESLSENRNSVVLAELPKNFLQAPDQTVVAVAATCNNAFGGSIFILGDESQELWQHVLCEAGAVESCFCMLDFEGLWSRIWRFLNRHSINEISVEQAVAARLRS